jgi:glycolate oxidase iron-sulfur subunit
MKTSLNNDFLKTPQGIEANDILRSCVHCGFCNATCPTYQLLGDELDGPRGRIYLIKQILEGATPGRQTQLHLDRCLTCRNCESTCPSGVKYSHLLDIGRSVVNKKVTRQKRQRLQHLILRKLFLSRHLFTALLRTGQFLRPVLPEAFRRSVPEKQKQLTHKNEHRQRKILLITGCVQPGLIPNIDTAARIVFDRIGVECIESPSTRCCGSLSHHLNAEDEALEIIRNNIDTWWPMIEQNNIEAICMTASGCGVAIKEYEHLLAHDMDYAERAKKISSLYRDPAEMIIPADLATKKANIERLAPHLKNQYQAIAFHPPCTLQHGMQVKNLIEPFMKQCGYEILPFKDNHLCCGSAGTYSITQKKLSRQLLDNKLESITEPNPDAIATANIGCQLHLQSGTDIPVKHWLELIS